MNYLLTWSLFAEVLKKLDKLLQVQLYIKKKKWSMLKEPLLNMPSIIKKERIFACWFTFKSFKSVFDGILLAWKWKKEPIASQHLGCSSSAKVNSVALEFLLLRSGDHEARISQHGECNRSAIGLMLKVQYTCLASVQLKGTLDVEITLPIYVVRSKKFEGFVKENFTAFVRHKRCGEYTSLRKQDLHIVT